MSITGADLAAADPATIEVGQVVSLDWHDGPREGFLRLSQPASCWHFRLYAEAAAPEDLDDRLYLFRAAPDDAIDRLTRALQALGPPSLPQWVPVWRFPGEDERRSADAAVDALIAEVGEPEVLVRSVGLVRLAERWLLVP